MTRLELCQALRKALEDFQIAVQENKDKNKITELQTEVDSLVIQLDRLDRKVA